MFSTLGRWCKGLSDSWKYLAASLAIVMVKRKLNQRPHDWSLWLTLARLYEIGYQWPQALDAIKRARKLNPQNKVIGEVLARVEKAAKQDSGNKVQSES